MSDTAPNEQQPLVTVIVPAWNAEATLQETLVSVGGQTYGNLEIIIVDDGSTDQTAAIADDFCAVDLRARVIRQQNQGVALARNAAIRQAKGEWIAPIDADDIWHPTKIEKQLAAALAAPVRPGFVYCWYRTIDEAGSVVGSGPRWALTGDAFTRLAYLNVVENGSALFLSRQALVEVGGYDASLRTEHAQGCEDVMLQLRIARNHPIVAVSEHLVGWRHHGHNMSHDFEQIFRSYRLVLRRLIAEGAPVPPQVGRWVEGRCSLESAEQWAVAGRPREMLRAICEGIVLDPVRSGSILLYRFIRSLNRRLSRHHSRQRLAPMFKDVDPAAQLVGDPYALPRLASIVARVDRRRLQRLAALHEAENSPLSHAA